MKKRKVLWVGVALAVSVALCASFAFLVKYNSTDAKIDRALAQIVEEYGFELQSRETGSFGWPERKVTDDLYLREPMGVITAGEIVAILREACPSFEYRQMTDEAWLEVHTFRPEQQDEALTARITFVPDDGGVTIPRSDPTAFLKVLKFERPGLWQRIKGLWAW